MRYREEHGARVTAGLGVADGRGRERLHGDLHSIVAEYACPGMREFLRHRFRSLVMEQNKQNKRYIYTKLIKETTRNWQL